MMIPQRTKRNFLLLTVFVLSSMAAQAASNQGQWLPQIHNRRVAYESLPAGTLYLKNNLITSTTDAVIAQPANEAITIFNTHNDQVAYYLPVEKRIMLYDTSVPPQPALVLVDGSKLTNWSVAKIQLFDNYLVYMVPNASTASLPFTLHMVNLKSGKEITDANGNMITFACDGYADMNSTGLVYSISSALVKSAPPSVTTEIHSVDLLGFNDKMLVSSKITSLTNVPLSIVPSHVVFFQQPLTGSVVWTAAWLEADAKNNAQVYYFDQSVTPPAVKALTKDTLGKSNLLAAKDFLVWGLSNGASSDYVQAQDLKGKVYINNMKVTNNAVTFSGDRDIYAYQQVTAQGSGSTAYQKSQLIMNTSLNTIPSAQLTVTVPAGGNATVTSSPVAINCPGTCTATFDKGENINFYVNVASTLHPKVFQGYKIGSTLYTCSSPQNTRTFICPLTLSGSTSLSILLDTTPPTGSIAIDPNSLFNGTVYTTDPKVPATVNLILAASDNSGGTGMARMLIYNEDGSNLQTVPYPAGSASVTIPSWPLSIGVGNKTVYVKYEDAARNASQIYSVNATVALLPKLSTPLTVADGSVRYFVDYYTQPTPAPVIVPLFISAAASNLSGATQMQVCYSYGVWSACDYSAWVPGAHPDNEAWVLPVEPLSYFKKLTVPTASYKTSYATIRPTGFYISIRFLNSDGSKISQTYTTDMYSFEDLGTDAFDAGLDASNTFTWWVSVGGSNPQTGQPFTCKDAAAYFAISSSNPAYYGNKKYSGHQVFYTPSVGYLPPSTNAVNWSGSFTDNNGPESTSGVYNNSSMGFPQLYLNPNFKNQVFTFNYALTQADGKTPATMVPSNGAFCHAYAVSAAGSGATAATIAYWEATCNKGFAASAGTRTRCIRFFSGKEYCDTTPTPNCGS